jgi:acetoin utilization deacetylase AcuC-like enzyme
VAHFQQELYFALFMLQIAYHPIYEHPLPEGHRFPMLKYELIPKQLLHEGIITPQNLFSPYPASEETITLTHDMDYWMRMKNLHLSEGEMRRIGFPLSAQLVEREIRIAQGTIDCISFAKQTGVALNVAGGTHHAFTYKGEGFCLLNDFAIAANHALKHNLATQILIIDLDVHQGNGTAQIFALNKNVFTLSMHGKHNYPFFKEQSDLDIELENGISDDDYLTLMRQYIPQTIKQVKPDLVFYLAGVDILATDKYGKLHISPDGCYARDELIFSWCKQAKIPVVVSMGGGYSPKIADIVNAHCNTFKAALKIFF